MSQARILNIAPSLNVESDWTYRDAVETLRLDSQLPSSKPTDSVDLRERWWDIGNQGPTGSCIGWAVADSLLRWHFVQQRRIPEDAHLSARFIWMAAKETDSQTSIPTTFIEKAFTSIKAGLDVARLFGVVREEELPFDSPRMYPGTVESFYQLAEQLKISAYYNLGVDFDHMRVWLQRCGPVLCRIVVDNDWLTATRRTARLETYRDPQFGHAAVLVGCAPDTLIVRNSWGTSWGDKGFAYLSVRYARCAIKEAYGVTV